MKKVLILLCSTFSSYQKTYHIVVIRKNFKEERERGKIKEDSYLKNKYLSFSISFHFLLLNIGLHYTAC